MRQFILLSLSFILAACDTQGSGKNGQTETAMPVTVVRPKAAVFQPALKLYGSIVAKESISVGTPLHGLQILSVNAEAGETVRAGQVLARLEAVNVDSQMRQHTAQLAKAKANLASQQSALKEAEGTLKRYRILIKSDAVSRQDLESQQVKVSAAQAAVKTANAEIAEIQAQLADSRNQQSKAEVLAPAGGVLIKRNAESGSLTDSTALFVIAKDGVLELEAQVNSDELAKLQAGQTARISANGNTLNGTVRLVLPELDSSNRQGKVRISLAGSALPIGAFAEAEIRLSEQQVALSLPLSAIAFDSQGNAGVMTVNGERTAVRKPITLGAIHNGQAEILDGLDIDEMVVKQAAAFIDEGDKVLPQVEER